MSLSELKDVIWQLSFEERAELNRLLYGWEHDDWDKQIAEDAKAGRFDEMIKLTRHKISDRWRGRAVPRGQMLKSSQTGYHNGQRLAPSRGCVKSIFVSR
jgi:hypothetical protein